MEILDLTSVCGSVGLANLISICKTALTIIQIAGPILAIVGLVTILIKLMSNPDNKKLKTAIKNWLIAFVVLFFIPIIVNVVMRMLDDSFTVAACWNYAEEIKSSGDATFIPDGNENRQHVVGNPDDYMTGEDSDDGSDDEQTQSGSTTTVTKKIIFIGDSRTVGMKNTVNSNDVWSCKESIGLDWMKQTGVPQIESSIANGSAVVILMGVNDLYNVSNYVTYINGKKTDWINKGAKVYFVSVLPTNGSYEQLNSEIDSFNNKIKTSLDSVKFIDTNSYLKTNGFKTVDGLHFDSATYQKIYNHIKSNL